jgi:S-DNA-T family DNA segregation ATPase FtsK/SpoIIIE
VRKGSSSSAADDRLQRELWALTLLALAVLLTLSFVPPRAFGATGVRLFPTGNIVGLVGGMISRSAWAAFGLPALLLPVLPAVWAAAVVDRLDRGAALRYTGLLTGVFLLVPTGIYAFARPMEAVPAVVGGLGAALGAPLASAFGWLGAGLLVSFLFAALCVATVGWNPLRTMLGGGRLAWSGTRRAVAGLATVSASIPLPSLERARPEKPAPRGAAQPADDDFLAWEIEDVFGEEETDFAREEDTLPEPPVRQSAAAPQPEPATVALPAAPRARRAAEPANEVVGEDTGDLQATDLPTTALLTSPPARDEAQNRRTLDHLGQVLIEKLETFKISGEIVGVTTGPVVTQFEVSPAPGIKVARIANLDADLALALRAPSVRIVAPIPGKGAVGVEVPNPEPEMVFFREVIESPAFRNSKAQLPLALGKDIAGKPYVADLAKMPHLLIAGATGSGKSVCVNTIITSLVYRHSPRSLRLLMVDPKMVELSMYNDLPHLRHPVVTDNNEAAGVLKWAVLEMERRYALLSVNGVRNLQDFNKRVESGQVMRTPDADGEEGDPDRWIYKAGPLPYIVLIIDELADLMMTVQGEVEKPLALLAQKSRAIGIHLILATQRPSVNVITGLIKANFPSRIAFRVSSKVDSRTILDQNGADNLLGNGDLLFLPPGLSDPVRCQGAFLSTEETEQLMEWYREQAKLRREALLADGLDPEEARDEEDILEIVRAREGDAGDSDAGDEALEDLDKLFHEAAQLCIQHQGGSTSLLQRRLRIGYGRAARIIDQLHHAGVLGPPDGSKPREVLIDLIQLDQMYPED